MGQFASSRLPPEDRHGPGAERLDLVRDLQDLADVGAFKAQTSDRALSPANPHAPARPTIATRTPTRRASPSVTCGGGPHHRPRLGQPSPAVG